MTITGRPATFGAIIVTGTASAALNCYGAFSLFNGLAAWIFLAAVFGMELLALLCLRHIVQDWQNHHRLKAALAMVIFVPLVICLLFLFELVKTGGRFAIATETQKTWSAARRKAHLRAVA